MGRGQARAKAIPMTALQFVLLQEESNKRRTQYQFKTRINLLLKARQAQSNSEVARYLAIWLNTVKTWRHRWQECYGQLCEYEKEMNSICIYPKALLMAESRGEPSNRELVC